MSESAFDNAYEWYTSGPRQRLQPGGAIISVMTRWGKKDLDWSFDWPRRAAISWRISGRLWSFLQFCPATSRCGLSSGKRRAVVDQGVFACGKVERAVAADADASESAIIKREWWQDWDKREIPR